MYSQSFLVSSVRGSGSLPTTAASAASGCTGLLRAFFGEAAFFGVGIGQLERAGLGSQAKNQPCFQRFAGAAVALYLNRRLFSVSVLGATQGTLRYDLISSNGPESIAAFPRENTRIGAADMPCHGEPPGFTPRAISHNRQKRKLSGGRRRLIGSYRSVPCVAPTLAIESPCAMSSMQICSGRGSNEKKFFPVY